MEREPRRLKQEAWLFWLLNKVFGEAQDGAPRAGCRRLQLLQLLPYWMGSTLSVLKVLTFPLWKPPWSPAAELVEAFIFLVANFLSWGLEAGR